MNSISDIAPEDFDFFTIFKFSFPVQANWRSCLLPAATMLRIVQAKPLLDPQVAEFHVEHPEAPASPKDQGRAVTGDFLIVSPYTSVPHLLDLRALDTAHQLLAKALTVLEATRLDYATASYVESFNWVAVCAKLKDLVRQQSYMWERQQFYIVVFRSRVPPTTNRLELGELDQKSHAEATKSGGLLKYWFGMPDADGRNLATCIWRKQSDARPASAGPGHRAAARATVSMYTEWRIERLKLEICDGVGGWSISQWED